MKGKMLKRMLGLCLAFTTVISSLPLQALAAEEVISEEYVQEDSGDIFDEEAFYEAEDEETDANGAGYVEYSYDFEVPENDTGEDYTWHEDPYPLDLLIIDPLEPDDEPFEFADEEAEFEEALTSGDFTYTVSGSKATITKYTGTDEEVVVPSTIDEYTVTTIGSSAFKSTSVKKVTISEGITSIGSYAFQSCHSLESVSLPKSLTKIDSYAFDSDSALTSITIPAGVTTFGNYAFRYSVKTIEFSEGMTILPSRACYGASYLENVVLPDSVTEIGEYSFAYCKKLTEITLPDSVTFVRSYAFYECTDLTEITLPKSLETLGSNVFYYCTALTQVVLPEGLKKIDSGVFYRCRSLGTILIPSTVTTIGRSAFYDSTSSIIFAEGMEVIPDSACDGATNLTEVALPSTTRTIGKRAFYGCEKLVDITIPDGTKTVGEYAFYGDKLLKISLPSSVETIGNNAFAGCTLYGSCGPDASWELSQEDNTAVITGSGMATGEGDNAFGALEDSIEFVEFDENITSIDDNTFNDMDKLKGVVMGDGITEVGTSAFESCDSLERVEFSKNLEKVGQKAFNGCSSIDTVIFTGSLPAMDDTALPDKKLTAYYPKTNSSYKNAGDLYKAFEWKQWDNTLPQRDVILVLDVSGSMSGSRIANLKTAVCAFADKVGGRVSNTRIGIVSYASDAKKVLSFTTDVGRIKASANRLSANGGTYYLKGFDVAQSMMSESKAGIKTLIVFSDGEPSDSRTTIVSRSDAFRDMGYYTYSVGLAPNENNRQLLINVAGDEDNYFEADDIDLLINRFVEISGGVGRTGNCGENAKWKYDSENNKLVISLVNKANGTGRIKNYSKTDVPAWDAYAETIECIAVEKGITYIGTDAFTGLPNVTKVYIDKTVTEIAAGAFAGCTKLKEVDYTGTEAQWKKISIGSNNKPLLNAKKNYNVKPSDDPDKDPAKVTGVTIDPLSLTMNINETANLKAVVAPKTAANKSVSWRSSNEKVAKVSKTGKVTAVAVGSAVITATTADGGYKSTCNVTVTNTIPVISKLDLGGSQSGLKVDKNVPIIGGQEYNISLPASLPVNCVIEDNKIKIGINIDKDELYSYNSSEGVTTTTGQKKSIKEEFEEFKANAYKANLMRKDKDWLKNVQDEKFLKANMPGAETAVEINCVGYLEGAWSNALTSIEGSVVVTIEGSATLQKQLVVWVIPVTVNCEFTASGCMTTTIGYNFEESKWYGDVELGFGFGIEPYAGVGFGQWVSAGVYGNAKTDFNIVVKSQNHKPLGLDTWSIAGQMGVKGYFAKKSANIALINKEYTIYDKSKGGWQKLSSYDATFMEEGLAEDELYIENLKAMPSVQLSAADEKGVIVSDVYNAAKPLFVSAGGTTMLIYVADDASRGTLDQTKLVYSVYDVTTKTYTSAQAVLDNGTADYEPEVYSDGKDIYVVWLDSSKKFGSSDAELSDYMKTFRTHVAKFDASKSSFTDLGSPQTADHYTYLPKLYMANGKISLAWVENKDDAIFGKSDNNVVYRGVYDGGSWSIAGEQAGYKAITSLAFGKSDANGVAVAFAADLDNDLTTPDQELYIFDVNGNNTKVASGNIAALSYTKIPGKSGNYLAANVNGGLYYVNSGSLMEVLPEGTMNNDTTFIVNGNNVYYLLSSKESRNICVSNYYSGKWGSALLTHESAYVDSFTIADGKVGYLYSEAKAGKNGIWDVRSQIKVLDSTEYEDVELETADFAVDDAYEGSKLPLSLYIKNNGTSNLRYAKATASYNGKEIAASDLNVDIMPGDVKPYDFLFDIPEDLSAGGDFVITVTSSNDSDPSNNSQTIALKKADLDVKASYDSNGDVPYVVVTVLNNGLLDSNMKMTVTDEKGKKFYEESALVKAGETATFYEPYEEGIPQTLTVTVKGDAAEFYEMNNTTWVRVGEEDDDLTASSFNVKFKDIVSDPYLGLSYNGDENRFETVFTGSAIKPEVVVSGLTGTLKEGVDYTLKYQGNVNVSAKNKTATVTVTGKGNYSGKKVLKYTIIPCDLEKARYTYKTLSVPESIKTVAGKKLSPVICYNDQYVLKASDMTLSNTSVIKADTNIYIKGKGNFTGALDSIPVSVITAKEMKEHTLKAEVKAKDHVYDAEEKTLSEEELIVTSEASKTPLVLGTDYKVSYKNNVNAGTATVTVKGLGEYFGTVSKTFKISPDTTSQITSSVRGTVTYSPKGAVPTVVVTKTGSRSETLVEGRDYKVTCSKNKAATTSKKKATYTVTFIGNYKGHAPIKNVKFSISKAAMSKASVLVSDMVYSKPGSYKAKPVVSLDGAELSSKNYTVRYTVDGKTLSKKNKIDLGDATSKEVRITITGKGNYSGSVSATYRVIKSVTTIDLSKAKIVAKAKKGKKDVAVGNQQYTGEEVQPKIRVLVKSGNSWIKVSPEYYKITYANNVNLGKATIMISGDGKNAVGGKTANFTIVNKKLDVFKFLFG